MSKISGSDPIQEFVARQLAKYDSHDHSRVCGYVRCECLDTFVSDVSEAMSTIDVLTLKHATRTRLVEMYLSIAAQVVQKWPIVVREVTSYFDNLCEWDEPDHPGLANALYLSSMSQYINRSCMKSELQEHELGCTFEFKSSYPPRAQHAQFPYMVVTKDDTTFIVIRTHDTLEHVLNMAYRGDSEVVINRANRDELGSLSVIPETCECLFEKVLADVVADPERSIVFCGIGIAGTIAALLAVEYAQRTNIRTSVFMFNAPRAGGQEFEDVLGKVTTAVSCRTVDNPMYLVGGAHVTRTGGTAYILGEHGVTEEPDGHPMKCQVPIGLQLATFFDLRQQFTDVDCAHGIFNCE